MLRVFFGLSALLALAWPLSAQADPGDIALDPALAINHPDEFNWQLFVEVNKPGHVTSRPEAVVWETWADDGQTFPDPTTMSAGDVPKWPDPEHACNNLRPNVQLTQRLGPTASPAVPPFPGAGNDQQETRRNKATFDFIVGKNLWHAAGLAAAFASTEPIEAPVPSIEVKADWFPASPGDEKTFHVSQDCNGKAWKLVALHIISKAIPNWTWATFEHLSNPGRCDFIGCKDSFGAKTVATSAPLNTNGIPIVGGQYPAAATCDKTAPLLASFKTAGLDPAIWGNYCLKGSQVDFTAPDGTPILLGNSVTEAGFVRTSSCMSCHARASTDGQGRGFLFPGFLNPAGEAARETAVGPIGTPLPEWFRLTDGNHTPFVKQTDFIWAMAFAQ